MAKVFTIAEGLENMGALKTGGQGSVYKGRRIGEIITAVKLLPTPIYSESAADKNFIDFQNEVQKLKKVNEFPNPNVVKILNSGISESGSFPFIEMEFIEGPDLEDLLKPPHDPVFSIKETIKISEQLSNALAHCHKVEVKHGDIKSNNVKFNIHTGNYVLLDFGLAVMSDEQRRTSLRHAGAIEFMAPEQNEGAMLFQTDVYGFGIIMYELLGGRVPFPLKDKGETARNTVMVAHMEAAVPDVMELRKQNLPPNWSAEKKDHEMNVPHWLLSMIYKCLEKKPEKRFANGMQLHEYICLNSTLTTSKTEIKGTSISALQGENQKLLEEKEQLQNILLQYQEAYGRKEQEIEILRSSLSNRTSGTSSFNDARTSYAPPVRERKGVSKFSFAILLLLTLGLGAFSAYTLISKRHQREVSSATKSADTTANTIAVENRKVIAQYKVGADRVYFYNQPDEATRRNAYLINSEEATISALEEQNGFIYTEFTNSRGQVSKGWLRKQDLLTVPEWTRRKNEAAKLSQQEMAAQLKTAKDLLEQNDLEGALNIYKTLSDQQVPEAMFYYGDLALRNKNQEIPCAEAIALVKKASDKNYVEAKRTLGFLYLFAESPQMLKVSNYDCCQYEKDLTQGTKLLMEAVLSGDTTARRILDLHKSTNREEDVAQ
jgi:serine/threonine-protein kinase